MLKNKFHQWIKICWKNRIWFRIDVCKIFDGDDRDEFSDVLSRFKNRKKISIKNELIEEYKKINPDFE